MASALMTLSALFAHSAGIEEPVDFASIARGTFEHVLVKRALDQVSA